MTHPIQPLPGEDSDAGRFARALAQLLGPAYQPADGTLVAADLYALGQALADARDTTLDAVAEAFAAEASRLLPELEASYGLAVRGDLTDAERRTILLAKVRAARAGTPQAIETALDPYDPDAKVFENTAAAVAATDPRAVFRVAVRIKVAVWNDAAKLAAIRALCEQMKPAHAKAAVCTRVGFRFNDPDSLFDRDVFGT